MLLLARMAAHEYNTAALHQYIEIKLLMLTAVPQEDRHLTHGGLYAVARRASAGRQHHQHSRCSASFGCSVIRVDMCYMALAAKQDSCRSTCYDIPTIATIARPRCPNSDESMLVAALLLDLHIPRHPAIHPCKLAMPINLLSPASTCSVMLSPKSATHHVPIPKYGIKDIKHLFENRSVTACRPPGAWRDNLVTGALHRQFIKKTDL